MKNLWEKYALHGVLSLQVTLNHSSISRANLQSQGVLVISSAELALAIDHSRSAPPLAMSRRRGGHGTHARHAGTRDGRKDGKKPGLKEGGREGGRDRQTGAGKGKSTRC